MKLRILTTVLVTSLSLIQPSVGNGQKRKESKQAKPATERWYVFASPDGDFTLSFPQKPSLKDVGPGPLTDVRELEFITPEGMRFSANFHDVGGDPNATESNRWMPQLEQVLSDFDRSQGLRVVQMHRVTPNTVEAEVWQPVPETNSTINYLRRSIIRHARVYTLACGWLVNEKPVANSAVCRRFFDSMRLTKSSNHSSHSHRKK